MSHWDVKETILASPDKQSRYFDFLSRLTHSIRIDHASVIVDRTSQITLDLKKKKKMKWNVDWVIRKMIRQVFQHLKATRKDLKEEKKDALNNRSKIKTQQHSSIEMKMWRGYHSLEDSHLFLHRLERIPKGTITEKAKENGPFEPDSVWQRHGTWIIYK